MAALLVGFVTNALPEALALGLVLELFWIDGLSLGTVVPPLATLSFLLLFPLCLLFGWYTPDQLPVPMLGCLVFAHVSAWLECWLRRCNASQDKALERWIEDPSSPRGLSPHQYIWRSHKRVLSVSILLYVLSFTILYVFFSFLLAQGLFLTVPILTWNILYGVGLVGAVLALRTRRIYMVLAMSVLLVLSALLVSGS